MKRHDGRDEPTTTTKALLAIGAGTLALIAAAIIRERRVPDPSKAPAALSEDPRPGDVLLYYRPRLGRDHLIRFLTRSPFYHAALYAGHNTLVEARPAGVRQNSMAGRENGFLVVRAPENKGRKALEWAKTQIGDSYDPEEGLVAGLEHLFVHWHINYTPPGNRYSCAELVTAAFEHAGFTPFPGREPQDIVPADWAEYLPSPYNSTMTKS